jgi:hypothetical protein
VPLLGARVPVVVARFRVVGETFRVVGMGMPGVGWPFRPVVKCCRVVIAGMPVSRASSFAGLDVV